ncbi:MAG: FAD-binding oxidoreductase [Candidatus Woesearchaeota archaeon]|nr:FAD-binding oxidoreductase [Candidatus Woesearchaeota archaeon]
MRSYLTTLRNAIGGRYVVTDEDSLNQVSVNTLGLERVIQGILYPGSREEVQKIVLIANEYGLKLHPISAGKNIGYGDMLPISDDQFIVNLSRMNRIREFSNDFGQVVIEAGVTQGQIMQYLQDHDADWLMDCSGIGPEGSIIGNTMEGGFGISELGNRRTNFTGVEVVLGNGTVFNTGTFPGLGPDVSGALIQSNFGIVTAIQMDLFRKPDYFESFMLRVNDERNLFEVLAKLRDFRYKKIVPGIGRTANALRSLVTFWDCPPEYDGRLITNEHAREILGEESIGLWTVFGSVYGMKDEVSIKKRVVQKEIGRLGELQFFSDKGITTTQDMIRLLLNMNKMTLGMAVPTVRMLRSAFGMTTPEDLADVVGKLDTYKLMHNMSKGIPPSTISYIKWRVDSLHDAGLMWYAPVVKATERNVEKMLYEARKLYDEYGFELPITLNLVTPDTVTGIMSIHFDRTDAYQVERAHQLYESLNIRLAKLGILPYRLGIQGQGNLGIIRYSDGKQAALSALKKAWDPNEVIQPGRYGISL